jgi:hypothetical protein
MKLVRIVPVVLLVFKAFDMMSKTDWWKDTLKGLKYKYNLN